MYNKILKKNNGFTLIETMVAVIILTFTISVFMNAVASSFFYARYASNEITANYLLQEVVDFIKNDRDTRVLLDTTGNNNWDLFVATYMDSCREGDDGCTLDATSNINSITPCDPDLGCPFLYYDSTPNPNFYNYDTNPPSVKTSFIRKITTKEITGGLYVTVKVTWKNGNKTQEKTLTTSIMKYYEG